MNEDLTWSEPHNFIGWNPGVGAPNPEILGLLDAGELAEEIGLFLDTLAGPLPVVPEDGMKVIQLILLLIHIRYNYETFLFLVINPLILIISHTRHGNRRTFPVVLRLMPEAQRQLFLLLFHKLLKGISLYFGI